MKIAVAAMLLASSLATPATARADCGDPGQDPCTGPVPTVDQVVAILAELTDPNKPAATKADIVTLASRRRSFTGRENAVPVVQSRPGT